MSAARDRRRRRRRDDGRRDRAAGARTAGARTLLHDPTPAALERGVAGSARLERAAERGDELEARGRRARGSSRSTTLAALAPCELVIEAAPERPRAQARAVRRARGGTSRADARARHQHLVAERDRDRRRRAAARARRRHALLQPAAADAAGRGRRRRRQSRRRRSRAPARLGEAMGRHVIDAADGAGFLVNRCNRPFALEALRLVQERLATPEQVDRICRLAGGFRMGPFELMDLVGIDVGFDDLEVVLRAVLRRAALAPVAAGRADGRRRPARPQDRARLVRVPRRAGRPTRAAGAGRRRRRLVVDRRRGASLRRCATPPRRPAGTCADAARRPRARCRR